MEVNINRISNSNSIHFLLICKDIVGESEFERQVSLNAVNMERNAQSIKKGSFTRQTDTSFLLKSKKQSKDNPKPERRFGSLGFRD